MFGSRISIRSTLGRSQARDSVISGSKGRALQRRKLGAWCRTAVIGRLVSRTAKSHQMLWRRPGLASHDQSMFTTSGWASWTV